MNNTIFVLLLIMGMVIVGYCFVEYLDRKDHKVA